MSLGVVATVAIVGKTALDTYGAYRAGQDAEDAYDQQALISAQEAEHRRFVAYENAKVYKEHAARLRGEQVNRINEYLRISTERLAQQRDQVLQRGVEQENDVRRTTAETISSQRAAAGAAGIMIDVGTPASLQIDTARLGEVDALRTRRNHRLEGEKIMQQVEDLQRDAAYAISDVNFEADQYDARAALTIIEGDAQFTAGLNRSDAYREAGDSARRRGVYDAFGAALGGAGQVAGFVDPKWFAK